MVKKLLILLVFCLMVSYSSIAQNTETTKSKADQDLKSSARVNPSTLAMEFSIPLGGYPGRNGNSTPIVLNYSSKVWNIDLFNSRFDSGSVPSNPNYDYEAFDSTDNMPMFAERSIAGWTSSLQTVGIVEDYLFFNQYGGIYKTYSGMFSRASLEGEPEEGWSCELQSRDTGEIATEFCPSGLAEYTTELCTNSGSGHQVLVNGYTVFLTGITARARVPGQHRFPISRFRYPKSHTQSNGQGSKCPMALLWNSELQTSYATCPHLKRAPRVPLVHILPSMVRECDS